MAASGRGVRPAARGSAASVMACLMRGYVPHRHRFPFIHWPMAASSGDRFSARSAAAARLWPGWQYPHWTTLPRCHASRTASMTGPEAPSTVVTALPTAVPAGVWHDLVLRPSRSTHTSGLPAKRSSTSTSAPFTFSFNDNLLDWVRAAASLSGLALVDPL